MEHFFTGLLVLVSLLVVWFAGYVVYRLYSDQR
ncbi:putative iron-regulated membrane protein [Saccharothrix tamanrassetensis]|uniref:Putative iron-regulated membrane protein n=1 Tax=Saccharothrix tamanrassetensis TaxID=1051531 RepID=A0A841CBL4_9PSEU|nr:putative iron-regulated membrane protein [Saccharothrix tamanrassetensis]